MLLNYEEMPSQSRIWVYQTNRQLTENEVFSLDNFLQKFLSTWEAHGVALRAAYQILHQRFVVLALDQNYHAASGCSIDASVHGLQEFGRQHQIDFFDRSQVLFLENNQLQALPIRELKNAVKMGKLQPQSLVFDTTVQQKKDLENWEKPAQQTWLSKYFAEV